MSSGSPPPPGYFQAYYQRNKEKIKARSAQRRRTKPQECREAVRKANSQPEAKARIREWFRSYAKASPAFEHAQEKYRAAHKDQNSARAKRWRERNPSKHLAKSMAYAGGRLVRSPRWLTADDFWLMNEFYLTAKERSKATGVKHHVDHVIPLRGKSVSGLHVPSNLQVVQAETNLRKSNVFQPGG